jgi:SAM-dependent methyltransferase
VFTEASAYDRFMGRYSTLLAPRMADFAGVASGQHVLDVGCGPGALTTELVSRLDAGSVAAIDPSEPFVAALRTRLPGVDARRGTAESLPFASGTFDAAIAQLVVHFMPDPVAGLAEMARVTRRGGVVAACVWDHERSPSTRFWKAARALDPSVADQADRPGAREGHLAELFRSAGLHDVASGSVDASRQHQTFEDWWAPFELGVGPVGAYLGRLDAAHRDAIRERCRAMSPRAPYLDTVVAWAARGRA